MTVKMQNTYFVSVPPRSSGSELHAAIKDLAHCKPEVRLMAASMRFATPGEICGLRALVDYAATKADTVVFDCPARDDVHAYLTRMNFYAELPPNVDLSREVPPLRRRDHRTKLIELVRIRTPDDVERLMERVHHVADAHLRTGLAAVACATALGEVTANVLDHAGAPEGALVAAQTYKTTGFELAVIDLGAGIPTTLARNPAHRGLADIDALQRSLKDGVSGMEEPGRGSGLADLVKAVGRAGSASLRLGSGRGQLSVGLTKGNQRRHRMVPAVAVPGTWISLTLEA
jgi:anti-sigma regulatory factor (Ser/Thr protein kinase)